MNPVLEVTGLTTRLQKKQGNITLVEGISFQIEKGESLGIVGESGCGKSVLSLSIMCLMGQECKVEGNVLLNQKQLLKLSDKELEKVRGKEISMIFQEPMSALNPVLTIGKQIGEVLEKHESLSGSQLKIRIIDLLTRVGIARAEEIIHEYPHRLSGGMRQRVMIAMAIACNPALLIADEPTTALDVTIQAQILDLLNEIRKDFDMSLILITHDLGVVAEVCDRVIVMYAGQIIESADVRTLLRNPKHPYTIGLMKSSPKKAKGAKRLYSLSGTVPSPSEYSNGCRFAPRCEHKMPICLEKTPELKPLEMRSSCRCWLYDQTSERVV